VDRVSSSGAAVLRFAPGQPILWRSVDSRKREVHTVWPRVTVTDGDDLIALYLPAGTVGKQRTGERGGPRGRMLIAWDGGHRDVLWERTNVLTLYRPGDAHSVWLAWDAASWELRWRYLNLEEPWRRTPIGFDSRDQLLDAWAAPDGVAWSWKDEDELAWAVENGRYTREEAEAIRAYGERALDALRRRSALDREWEGWRPDPAWPVPTAPEDWRELEPSRSSQP